MLIQAGLGPWDPTGDDSRGGTVLQGPGEERGRETQSPSSLLIGALRIQ